MLTAIAVLLLSAVGGGVIGSYLTTSNSESTICSQCEDKSIYQEEVQYNRLVDIDSEENEKNEDFDNFENRESEF